MNRAIDHVTRHLAEPLNLEELAKVACFSPFHFHRIFRSVVGETVHDFVKRTRLERALFLMQNDARRSLTDIALACGFSSSSDFSRSFRAFFGASPRSFDLERYRAERTEALLATMSKLSTDTGDFDVVIRSLPARRIAYSRVFQPFVEGRVPAACASLVRWATERGLERGQWLGYQWEDPELVPLEKCRYDVAVEVPEDVRIDGEVNEGRFPAMRVAEIEIKGGLDVELRALQWIYDTWLPRSGFAPDHQPGFEAWIGLPYAHGLEHFELKIQLAVVDADDALRL